MSVEGFCLITVMTVEIVRNSSEIWSNLDKFKYLFCVSLILVSGCSVSDL